MSASIEALIRRVDSSIAELRALRAGLERELLEREPVDIYDKGMGVRAENALIRANIRSIRQLTQRTRAEVMALNNIGDQSLRAIELALLVNGYALKDES